MVKRIELGSRQLWIKIMALPQSCMFLYEKLLNFSKAEFADLYNFSPIVSYYFSIFNIFSYFNS